MIGIVVVAHAPLGTAFHACASHVFQTPGLLWCVDVGAEDDPLATEADVLRCIAEADRGDGVLVMVDLVGATPANAACRAVAQARSAGRQIAMLGGMNAPMLLRALTYQRSALGALAQRVLDGGRHAVVALDAPCVTPGSPPLIRS